MLKIVNKFKVGYWNIGIIEKTIQEVMKQEPYSIRWVKHRYRDRFFADPFLYKVDGEHYYIFVEELIFKKNKGTIVLLKINKKTMRLVDRTEILEDAFHLSYPNYKNESIIAENYKGGGVFRFRLSEGYEKEKICDVPLIDPTLVEHNGVQWLFGTTKEQEEDANKKLSIFYKEKDKYIPHKMNPVKVELKSARPGGNFFEYEGNLYRPAQNCERMYGEDIRIMKIIKLDKEEFCEEEVMAISSHGCTKYNMGLHTFNVYSDFIVVDGYGQTIQILQKIRNKLFGY